MLQNFIDLQAALIKYTILPITFFLFKDHFFGNNQNYLNNLLYYKIFRKYVKIKIYKIFAKISQILYNPLLSQFCLLKIMS